MWTIVIVVFGVAAAAVALGSATSLFVEGELGRMIGSRKLESRIKHLSDHVIICGFGRMGELLTQQLVEHGVPVVVIEQDPNRSRAIEEIGQLYIVGDAASEKSLEKAGIERARTLVSVLPGDAENVFVTLTARQVRPDMQIIARAEQLTSESKIRQAGADRVVSTQSIGAERIANVITKPHLVDFVDVAAQGVELEMCELRVADDSPLAGKTLQESEVRQKADVMVVAICRPDGSTDFNPGAHVRIRSRDILITIGPSGAASRLEAMRLSQPGFELEGGT
jgi:voltage-gated potassium channel